LDPDVDVFFKLHKMFTISRFSDILCLPFTYGVSMMEMINSKYVAAWRNHFARQDAESQARAIRA
jgi:hypothetical protein